MFDSANSERVGYNPEFVRRVMASRDEKAKQAALDMMQEVRHEGRIMILKAKAQAARILKEARKQAADIVSGAKLVIAKNVELPQKEVRPMKEIALEAAATFNVSLGQLQGPSRAKGIVVARHSVMAAIYVNRPDLSLSQIGKFFNRDHTTVLHALRKLGVWRGATEVTP